jgi:hypothetical protein
MRNAELKKEAKNSEFHIPNSEFANPLASGPQACFFPEKTVAKAGKDLGMSPSGKKDG